MNRLVVFKEECVGNKCIITDSIRIKHITIILKSKIDDTLRLVLIDEGFKEAQLTKIESSCVELQIIASSKAESGFCNLVVGFSRPQTCKKILEHGTTYGVKSFNFFQSANGEKSYSKSKVLSDNNYLKYCYNGISQSNRFFETPTISKREYFNPDNFKDLPQKIILSKNASKWLSDIKIDFNKDITLIIGSERGLTSSEEKTFIESGATPVKISHSTLRVEHALFSTLAQIEMLRCHALYRLQQ